MDALKVVYQSLDTMRGFRNDFVIQQAEMLEVTDPARTHSFIIVKDWASVVRASGVINKSMNRIGTNVRSINESVRPISDTIHESAAVSFDPPSPGTFRDFLSPSPAPCLSTDAGSKGTAREMGSRVSLDFSVRNLRDDIDERNEDNTEDSNDEGEDRTENPNAPIGIPMIEATDSDYDDEPKKKKRRTSGSNNTSRQQKIPPQSRKQQPELRSLARQERVRREESDWYWLDTALSKSPNSTIQFTSRDVQDLMLDLPRAMVETPDSIE